MRPSFRRLAAAPAVFMVLCLAAFGAGCSSSPASMETRLKPDRNPFGVMPGADNASSAQGVPFAGELGVPLYRPHDISLEAWNGQDQGLETPLAAGMELALTVRCKGASWPSLSPSSPPADLQKYRQELGAILDAYPPDILFVENEEDAPASWSGTPEQYGVLLEAGCEAAHARGARCANGGLSCDLVILLTWDHYREEGRNAEAEDFFRRAASPGLSGTLGSEEGKSRAGYRVMMGKRFLAQYRKVGADYVNFHWYVSDPGALGEAVDFLRGATGLQPVCNEMGRDDTGPDGVTAELEESLRLGMPCVVWSSIDKGSARALQNPDWTLRENGLAFKSFIEETF